jgi:hypothetical protein
MTRAEQTRVMLERIAATEDILEEPPRYESEPPAMKIQVIAVATEPQRQGVYGFGDW